MEDPAPYEIPADQEIVSESDSRLLDVAWKDGKLMKRVAVHRTVWKGGKIIAAGLHDEWVEVTEVP